MPALIERRRFPVSGAFGTGKTPMGDEAAMQAASGATGNRRLNRTGPSFRRFYHHAFPQIPRA
jgi:hypothetical protein